MIYTYTNYLTTLDQLELSPRGPALPPLRGHAGVKDVTLLYCILFYYITLYYIILCYCLHSCVLHVY